MAFGPSLVGPSKQEASLVDTAAGAALFLLLALFWGVLGWVSLLEMIALAVLGGILWRETSVRERLLEKLFPPVKATRETKDRALKVVITGASSGLGRSMAHVFAKKYGAQLLLAARRKEALEVKRGYPCFFFVVALLTP